LKPLSKLDIYTSHFFPFHFIALGVGLFLFGIITFFMNTVVAIILILTGFLFTSTHYRVKIDLKQKRFKEYLWIMGFQQGQSMPYERMDSLYVNDVKYGRAYGFVTRINASGRIYKAYLNFTDHDEPVFIGEHKKLEKLKRKLDRIAKVIDLPVIENY